MGAPPSSRCDTDEVIERSWGEVEATLRERTSVPSAQASADLLGHAQTNWERRVLPDLWMHDLRFVAPGDTGRGVDEIRVTWEAGVYTFTLRNSDGLVVTADHARLPAALDVLDAFLLQLVGDS